ncbi:hypothetical protein Tco_1314510 [Tanacetum coccineum]
MFLGVCLWTRPRVMYEGIENNELTVGGSGVCPRSNSFEFEIIDPHTRLWDGEVAWGASRERTRVNTESYDLCASLCDYSIAAGVDLTFDWF